MFNVKPRAVDFYHNLIINILRMNRQASIEPPSIGAFLLQKIFSKIFSHFRNISAFLCRGIYREDCSSVLRCVFLFVDTGCAYGVRTIEFPDERDTQRDGCAMTACREARAPEKEV